MILRREVVGDLRYYWKGTSIWAHTRMDLRRRVRDRQAKPIFTPLDTSGFALPKPGAREKQQPKDGRLIEKPHEYSRTKHRMWDEQHGRCAREKDGKTCGRFMPTPAYGHRHHVNGRGIGGGKRDDRETVLICIECHQEEHQ